MRKDGAIIWVLINWTVVRDAEGRPPRTVANIQDITERKRAEEALRAKEAQLRAILTIPQPSSSSKTSRAVTCGSTAGMRFCRRDGGRGKRQDRLRLAAKEIADALRANDQEVIAGQYAASV